MRYTNIGIIVPWFEPNGDRVLTRLRFHGTVDRRRVRREMKRTFSQTGCRLRNDYIDHLLKHRTYEL